MINIIFFRELSVVDIFINILNDFCGPYISCHFLSLYIYIFMSDIVGIIIFVVVVWLYHNVMADLPMEIDFLLLDDNITPNNIPRININIIFILNVKGIIISCWGLIIHVIEVPDIIVIIIITEIGINDKLLMWFFELDIDFNKNLFDIIDNRIE